MNTRIANEKVLQLLDHQKDMIKHVLDASINKEIVEILCKQRDTLVTPKDYSVTEPRRGGSRRGEIDWCD